MCFHTKRLYDWSIRFRADSTDELIFCGTVSKIITLLSGTFFCNIHEKINYEKNKVS